MLISLHIGTYYDFALGEKSPTIGVVCEIWYLLTPSIWIWAMVCEIKNSLLS